MAKVVDINVGSRRALITGAMWNIADEQPEFIQTNDERLMLLQERLGDVAAAHLRGHRNVEDELLKLLATTAAFLEETTRKAAA